MGGHDHAPGASDPHSGDVLVLKGYLVTHTDGYEVRIAPDRARAELYCVRNHATLEPLYVRRRNLPTHPAAPTA